MPRKALEVVLFAMLILLSIPLYGDTNILDNPGFESGTTGWSARGGGSISTVTSPVHSGSYSGRAYGRTATWHGIQQNMMGKMVEGATYTVSGWVRTNNSASSTIHISFQQTDGNGTNYSWAANGTASNSGWTQISGSFTLNVTGTLTELLVYAEGPDSGIDIYLDDAVVYGPEVSSGDPTANGTVNVNTRHQTIDGFGAAGAWYEGTLVSLGQSQPQIYDILFGDLGLDIYRLRNAYDQDGATGYMSNSSTIISNGEASLGRPLKTLICAWSPPAYLKSNGDTANGGTIIGGPTNYDYAGYADWWADSITAWAGYGVDADYISIQNEVDYTATWDSCRFDPTQNSTNAGYDQAFEAVYNEFDSRFGSSKPKMLAPETTGFNGAAGGSPSDYISALINQSHAYGYAHHLYNINAGDNPDAYLSAMQSFNTSWGTKPLFQTEYEKSTSSWPDALDIALLLHNSLTVEEVSGYLYWDLFWGTAGSGLVYITSSSYTIYNDYYGFKQYSAFIHSDWQRVDTTEDSADVRMSAYISPDNSEVSVVIINTNSTIDINLTLSFAGLSILSGDVYRTSQTENCASVGSFNPANPLTLPAQSVTTLSLMADTGLTPPNPPQGLVATAGDATVSLDWTANTESDLAGYNVYQSTTPGGGYTQLNSSLLSSPGFTDNTVTNYTTYYYVVTAVDTDTNESTYSVEENAMPNDGSIVQLSAADFESGFGDWVNISGEDSHDWTRNSGGTPSPNTGPDSGANSSTWYVYLECSSGGASNAGDTAILESPLINGLGRVLTFYYHMYGSSIGTLNVDVYDGTWHEAVWNLSGQQHTSNSEEYTQATVDLTSYTGSIQIRFRAVAAGGFQGDMAIDSIEVTGSPIEPIYGDLSGDGNVNADDLPLFMTYWLLNDCIDLDLNGDCLINLREFAEFANNWLND